MVLAIAMMGCPTRPALAALSLDASPATTQPGSRVFLTAVTTDSDGEPIAEFVDFAATGRGRLVDARVMSDATGTARTSLESSSEGEVTVTATAAGTTASATVSFRFATDSRPLILRFRASPSNTQINSPLRPAPQVEVVRYSPLNNEFFLTSAEVQIALALTSCTATLDQRSQMTFTSLGGVAGFDNIVFTTPATGCTLTATSPGLTSAQSTGFDLLP